MNNEITIKETIGNNINDLLAKLSNVDRKRGTQKSLASALGVKPNTISYFCKGTRMPNINQLCGIADYFGVTVDRIIGKSKSSLPADSEITFLTDKIGFSEFAAAKLTHECRLIHRLDTLSHLIEQKEFVELLDALGRCETLYKHEVPFLEITDQFIDYVKKYGESDHQQERMLAGIEKTKKMVTPSERSDHKFGALYEPQHIMAKIAERFVKGSRKEGNDAFSTEENE